MSGDLFVLGGDPMSIAASGVQWQLFAAQTCDAAADLRGAVQASTPFEGDEGDVLRERVASDAAAGLAVASDAWRIVGDALIRYATQLDSCQAQLRSLGAVAADQRSQAAAIRSSVMLAAPAQVAEADQHVALTSGRAASVRAEHDAAVRACLRAIDLAIALAPVPPPGVRGVVAAPAGIGGVGTREVTFAAGRLRVAAATSTRLAAFGLRGDTVAFAPPSGAGPTSKDQLEERLYEHCMATQDDLDGSGPCRSFAASAVYDVAALQLAVDIYPSVLGWPEQDFAEKGAWYRRFAVEMVAGALGIEDCVGGDAGGCAEEAGAFVIGGIVGKTLQRIARALKGAKAADEVAEVVEDLPPAVVPEDVVRQRSDEWRRELAPRDHDQLAVPEEWIDMTSRRTPGDWGTPMRGKPSKDNSGRVSMRIFGPGGRTIRIDQGQPQSPFASQRVDHVRLNVGHLLIDRSGNRVEGGQSAAEIAEATHIPLSEWRGWATWDHP